MCPGVGFAFFQVIREVDFEGRRLPVKNVGNPVQCIQVLRFHSEGDICHNTCGSQEFDRSFRIAFR